MAAQLLFDQVLEQVSVNIRRFAASLVTRRDVAEDIAQEAILVLVRDRAQYEVIQDADALKARLTGAGIQATRFVWIGWRRRRSNNAPGLESAPERAVDPEVLDRMELDEQRKAMLEAARSISAECARIIHFLLGGAKAREMWEKLKPGIDLGAWNVRVTRCQQNLVRKMKEASKGD